MAKILHPPRLTPTANYSCKVFPYGLPISYSISVTDDNHEKRPTFKCAD